MGNLSGIMSEWASVGPRANLFPRILRSLSFQVREFTCSRSCHGSYQRKQRAPLGKLLPIILKDRDLQKYRISCLGFWSFDCYKRVPYDCKKCFESKFSTASRASAHTSDCWTDSRLVLDFNFTVCILFKCFSDDKLMIVTDDSI